jgi:hypothetical protein
LGAEGVAALAQAVALLDEVEVLGGLEVAEVVEEEGGVGGGGGGGRVGGGLREVAEELEGFERDGRLELGVAEGLEEAEAGGLFLFVEDFGAGEGGLVVLVVLVVLVLVLVLLF